MSVNDALLTRDRWARLRFSILGPLLAAPPKGRGELRGRLKELAKQPYRHPVREHEQVRFGYSTIERWWYCCKDATDPVAALREYPRSHGGRRRSLSPIAIKELTALYQSNPNWSAQLLWENLRVVLDERERGKRQPSYSSVRRYLKAQGMFKRPKPKRDTEGAILAAERLERLEVRSYESPYVLGLVHADFHKGSRKVLTKAGELVTPILFGAIDDRSRLVCHAQWYLNEQAETLVHGMSQAFARRGLPRLVMTDNGAAMKSEEFTEGLLRLGIEHRPTLPYSPYINGKQEVFWAQVEGRLMPMLQGEEPLTLDLLNRATHAWVEFEYNRKVHDEIGTTPLNRYLVGPSVRRECPSSEELRAAFRQQIERKQRRSDGTVLIEKQRFEIPSRYRHLQKVHLRYARWDLSGVDLIDANANTILAPVFPQDKAANAEGCRRPLEPLTSEAQPPASTGMAPLMKKLLADFAATGLPPAFVPTDTGTSAQEVNR